MQYLTFLLSRKKMYAHLTSLEGNKHNFLKMRVLMFQKVQNYRFSETIDMYLFIPP